MSHILAGDERRIGVYHGRLDMTEAEMVPILEPEVLNFYTPEGTIIVTLAWSGIKVVSDGRLLIQPAGQSEVFVSTQPW